MGAFIYVFLVFLVTHKDEHTEFIPQVSLITSWFLVLGAFGFLVFYSHRVAVLIQNPDAIGRIVADLRRANALAPAGSASGSKRRALGAGETQRQLNGDANDNINDNINGDINDRAIFLSPTSGYLQLIDHPPLIAGAAQAGASISVLFRPGQFVLEGEALASVSPASALPSLAPLLTRGISMGHHRVLAQDLEFGIAQIVEIAIRALSPAINDTFTGVACVDLLGESLTILSAGPQPSGLWFDLDGKLRLQVRPLLLPRLVKQAFDQIRQAAADNPAVLIRLLSTIGRLAPKFQSAEDRKALAEQAAAVWETANTRPLVKMDMEDIDAAWQRARNAVVLGFPSVSE
jgi:uncharacterized membrane protein